ncbi:MAG: QueT transporter family protein [Ruminococcaceae bacterium]|nr:QueT transporter family protein [Oscillospiraceae bacterium]
MGALRPFSLGATAPIFYFQENTMRKNTRHLVHCAMIAALYMVLTHLQNLLIPGSASFAIQFRASEALCVLAFFTPAAIPGLTLGTLLFNISTNALPLDFLMGSAATFLAAISMRGCRNITIKGYPLLGLLMPALWNGLIIGWELAVIIGGGFWYNAITVAIGELGVLLTLGSALYYALRLRNLDKKLFS